MCKPKAKSAVPHDFALGTDEGHASPGHQAESPICSKKPSLRNAMPSKPSRPIQMMTWDECNKRCIHTTEFSRDIKDLERDWATRFARLWTEGHIDDSVSVDPSPEFSEPADILLKTGDGQAIDLQITEAVDANRRRRELYRDYVEPKIFDPSDPEARELVTKLSGMQVALSDHTPVRFQSAQTPQSRSEAVREIRQALKTCFERTPFLPFDAPTWPLPAWTELKHQSGMWQFLSPARYATVCLRRPFKFMWLIGNVDPPTPGYYVLSAVKRKVGKSYCRGKNDLWLLVYAVDCLFSREEERLIIEFLKSACANPFARIFFIDASYPIQIWPPSDNSKVLRERDGGSAIYAQDALPDLHDERWRYFPPS